MRLLRLGAVLLVLTRLAGAAADLNVDRYAWEFPVADNIPTASTAWLRTELLTQIDDVLKAGFLTPFRVSHADEATDAYFVYLEPGRIVTTLGWAYPHLTADQQAAAQRYVHEHFTSDTFAPWNPGRLDADVPGTRREFHSIHRVGNWSSGWQVIRLTVQFLYGVWL